MRLYVYRGLDGEKAPKDVIHVIVHESVTIIRRRAFKVCKHLVSLIMGDNVKKIEMETFYCCYKLRFIRLSKTLEYIGKTVFSYCESLEALFLPSTVLSCQSLRLLLLPNNIDLSNIKRGIILNTAIGSTSESVCTAHKYGGHNKYMTDESFRRVNEWLFHHMDESPFHKLCYSSSVTTRRINEYLDQKGNNSVLRVDSIQGMTPLHIGALLDSNIEAIFCLDNQQKNPLDCARDYNIVGLVGMVASLCNHRNSSVSSKRTRPGENAVGNSEKVARLNESSDLLTKRKRKKKTK